MSRRHSRENSPPVGASSAELSAVWRWPRLHPDALAAIGIFAVSALWHGLLGWHAEPNIFPDSGSFVALAEALRDGVWKGGFTFRTPGYPAFLWAVFQVGGWQNYQAVLAAQFALSATTPLLLYALFRLVTEERWVAALGALSYLLDRYSIGTAAVPLSEFLGGYTVLAALVSFLYGVARLSYPWALVSGGVAAYNFFVRPSFQYVYWAWALTAIVVCWQRARSAGTLSKLLRWVGIYLLVIQAAIWAWSAVLWRHTGVFAPSLQLGASLTNHTGAWMELAPDRYATIRDLYVQERTKRGGNHINLFDEAGWKIAEATSMTLWQLSWNLREIDAYLIFHYPERYWAQVRRAWERIWTEDSRYIVDLTDPFAHPEHRVRETNYFAFIVRNEPAKLIYGPIEELLWREPSVLRSVPHVIAFLALVLVYFLRRQYVAILAILSLVGTIFYHMLVHVLVQYTEFGRYKLPVQGLWFSFLWFAFFFLVGRAASHLRRLLADSEPVRAEGARQLKNDRTAKYAKAEAKAPRGKNEPRSSRRRD